MFHCKSRYTSVRARALVVVGLTLWLREVSSFAHANPLLFRKVQDQHKLSPYSSASCKHGSSNFLIQDILSFRGGASDTTSTQLQSTTFSAIAAAVDTFWRTQPFAVAAMVCGTKACLADGVAQKIAQKSAEHESSNPLMHHFDWARNFSFILYGALYQGIAQEFIYNNFYTYLFGSGVNAMVVTKKVLFDAVFHNALLCIPMAYVVRGLVSSMSSGPSSEEAKKRTRFFSSLRESLQKYKDDVLHRGLLKKYYSLWMPVNCMIFTIIPKHYRITVMATISFFWMIILSTISSRKRD